MLSCCLLDGDDVVARAVMGKITPKSFYDQKHETIYSVILDLYTNKKPIDTGTIAEELKVRGWLEQIGGYAMLTQVSSRIPTTAQVPYFIEKVRDYAQLRELIKVSSAMVEDCHNFSGGIEEFLSSIEKKFIRAMSAYAVDNKQSLAEVCKTISEKVAAIRDGKSQGNENDISWGFDEADRYLRPFRRGELVTVAARPGIGKSSLIRQICFKNVVRDGKNIAVFTLEVSTEEFVNNMAQAASGVNPREIRIYPREEQDSFMKWVDRIGAFDKTLHIYDVNSSLQNIVATVRLHHARQPIDMVIIDYLQLINEKQSNGENRDQLMGRITRQLKLLAMELNCVVIILSQLNRASEKENRPPHLADLRESGNIEQDSDRVVFIHRPNTDPEGREQHFDDEDVKFFYCVLLQRKGRNVGEHSLGMQFQRLAARFLPITRPQS